MEQSITTTSQALTPEQAQQMLEADQQKMSAPRGFSVPMIRLSNKDMTQAPEGEYFIEKRQKDADPEITPIGPDPVITILYKTNTYSYYTPEHGLIAWTSDIHGFGPLDNVTLFKKVDGKAVVDFEGSYPEFKGFMQARYTMIDPITGDSKKLLKFKTVLYVEYQGEGYKMFVSNASSAGTDANGKLMFESPTEDSFQAYTDFCRQNKRALL